MKITNYNEFKEECLNVKKYEYSSPETALWKKSVLEYIEHKYEKLDYKACKHVINNGSLELDKICLDPQKKFKNTVKWIEGYVKGLNDGKQNNESFSTERKPINENILNIINGPKYKFHDEIIKHASNKIQSKDYNRVINECCKSFEAYIQKKSKDDSTGIKLVGAVFNKKRPILKIIDECSQKLNSHSNDDRQESIMHLSKGLICIRNILSHSTEIDYKLTENDMIEMLFLINYLFKQIDKMTV